MIEWVLILSTYMPGTDEVIQRVIPGFETKEKCQEAMKPIGLEMTVQEMKIRMDVKKPRSSRNENPTSIYGCKSIEK